jgi:hypothetical protein
MPDCALPPEFKFAGQQREQIKRKIPLMYQLNQFRNAATLTLAVLIILFAKTSFAQVNYSTFNYPDAMGGSTFLTGVRGAAGPGVYITGTFRPQNSSDTQGLLYQGRLSGGGQWTVLNFPSSGGITVTSTALYGPNGLPGENVRLVGSYKQSDTQYDHGLLYEGPPDGSGTWQTIDYPSVGETVLNTIAHSTMGTLVVGNFDTNLATGRAFVYEIASNSWVELQKPGAISITAYGIWHDGGTHYTIAGGYSDGNLLGIDHGYLVNWDSATQMASGWTSYDFANRRIGVAISHFDGVTTDNHGGFYLTGDWVGVIPPNAGAFFAHVGRMPHGVFGEARWIPIAYPSSDLTSGNTVYENNVLGIYTAEGSDVANGFVATVAAPR